MLVQNNMRKAKTNKTTSHPSSNGRREGRSFRHTGPGHTGPGAHRATTKNESRSSKTNVVEVGGGGGRELLRGVVRLAGLGTGAPKEGTLALALGAG